MEEGHLAASKKNLRPKDTIVFLDESGFSQRPSIRRTWSPRGVTPVLRPRTRRWEQLSAIGALTYRRDGGRARPLLMLHPGPTCSEEILAFLTHLRRHLRGRLLLLWDGAGPHLSTQVADAIHQRKAWLTVRRLPAYAPELNPVEAMWAWIKGCHPANLCPNELDPVCQAVGRATRSLHNQKPLLMAFLQKTGLSL